MYIAPKSQGKNNIKKFLEKLNENACMRYITMGTPLNFGLLGSLPVEIPTW